MSSDQPRRRESSGSPGSPMGSTAAIIIAIVAVVAGFLILRQIGDDDDDGGVIDTSDSTLSTQQSVVATEPIVTQATAPPVTESTVFTPVTEGAIAIVANASTVNGAARVLTTSFSGAGFTVGEPTNATVKQDASTVLYDSTDPDALAVASSIATLMGNIEVLEIASPAPIDGGVLPDGTSIVVMLGNDKANQRLQDMGTSTTLPATSLPGDTTSESTTAP